MSAANTDPSLLAAFGQYESSFDQVEADNGNGSRGIWPPEAELLGLVRGVAIRRGNFYGVNKADKKAKIPATIIQFLYSTLPDHPTMPNHPFGGVEFSLPDNPAAAGDAAWRLDADQKRLKGHLQVCLGDNFASGPGGFRANMENLISRANSPFVVKLKLDRRPKGEGKAGTYDTDYLLSSE
jgi:hypothetical protein